MVTQWVVGFPVRIAKDILAVFGSLLIVSLIVVFAVACSGEQAAEPSLRRTRRAAMSPTTC
jgi:hypothetical protein